MSKIYGLTNDYVKGRWGNVTKLRSALDII